MVFIRELLIKSFMMNKDSVTNKVLIKFSVL
jgi:hypothetical protein